MDDGPVEAGVMVGEADLEQVGAGSGDLVELTALGAGRMQSGGDEHAERAAGLGEESLEGVGGGQEMSFSEGAVAAGQRWRGAGEGEEVTRVVALWPWAARARGVVSVVGWWPKAGATRSRAWAICRAWS
ncbi:lytic transglycosylase [Streptomyces sp. KO7888]|nr:lytic transglycosylase [Streptomyces sp. KO7888]